MPENALLVIEGGFWIASPNVLDRERKPSTSSCSPRRRSGRRRRRHHPVGGGSDGTLGVKAIKEGGGFTIAQGPDDIRPRYSGMPDSAIATGLVDLVLPADEMAARLVDVRPRASNLDDWRTMTANEAGQRTARRTISAILRNQIGHDFSGYKQNTFLRRVQRRMQALQLQPSTTTRVSASGTGRGRRCLFRDLLISVTSFFRDAEPFEAAGEMVIPRLFEGKEPSDTVRVWVPGCATGEEVYSIAMLLREHWTRFTPCRRSRSSPPTSTNARWTWPAPERYPASLLDVSRRSGCSASSSRTAPATSLRKEIRDLCIFSPHSVIRDPPFSRIDLISCRNLLIYLGAELQNQVIPIFHYALRPGGYLFLGTSENIGQHATCSPRSTRSTGSSAGGTRAEPTPISRRRCQAASPLRSAGRPSRPARPGLCRLLRRQVEARVLDRFAPAHVVVNQDGEVIYYSASTGKYLEAPSGAPTGSCWR